MRRNFSENLLSIIDELCASTIVIFSRAGMGQKMQQLCKIAGAGTGQFNRTFERFGRSKLWSSFSKNGQTNYRLTAKGLNKLTEYRVRRKIKDFNVNDWDGMWRVIIFDVPEDKKAAREALRRKLKYFNFYPLQKSVFVFPFKCEEQIGIMADIFKIDKCVEIILAKSLGRKEKGIRQFFGVDV